MFTMWVYTINVNDKLFNEPKKVPLKSQKKELAVKETARHLKKNYKNCVGTRIRIFKKIEPKDTTLSWSKDIWNGVWDGKALKEA